MKASPTTCSAEGATARRLVGLPIRPRHQWPLPALRAPAMLLDVGHKHVIGESVDIHTRHVTAFAIKVDIADAQRSHVLQRHRASFIALRHSRDPEATQTLSFCFCSIRINHDPMLERCSSCHVIDGSPSAPMIHQRPQEVDHLRWRRPSSFGGLFPAYGVVAEDHFERGRS